jgi:hypothetical protein
MPKMLKVVRAEILLALEIAEEPAAALEQFTAIAEARQSVYNELGREVANVTPLSLIVRSSAFPDRL